MDIDHITKRFAAAGFPLDEAKALQFIKYFELLVEWNAKFNLTAITEPDEVISKHFIDSLLGAKYFDTTDTTLIDVGTGAGFPGIPLKIYYPELSVFLLDSLKKRVDFLNVVISELGLSGIEAMHGRAEEISRKADFREKYDVCVSRAVANMASLSELCLPFVRTGGRFVAYKSVKAAEELKAAENAVKLLGGKAKLVEENFEEQVRSFLIVEKIKETPAKYPRAGGKPFSKPL